MDLSTLSKCLLTLADFQRLKKRFTVGNRPGKRTFLFTFLTFLLFPHHPRGDGSVFNRWVVRLRASASACVCARVCPQCPLRYIFLRKFLKSWLQNCPATAAEKKCPRRLPPKGKYVLRRFSANATEVHKLSEQRELYSERLSRPAENFVRQDVNSKNFKNFQKISKISKNFKNFKKK